MNDATHDASFLREALREADRRRGFCSPNPAVGAVVAKHGQVIARGHHRQAGLPHAEVEALAAVTSDEARGATVYVTLEPCCHTGRTPPCIDLLIGKNVGRVVFGFRDPNPRVDGGGIAALQAAGIPTEHHRLAEIDAFYESYAHWTRTGFPFVTAKLALSLDGKIAGLEGKPVRLTGPEADARTHESRRRADAILTTVRTVLADDPRLDARTADGSFRKTVYLLDRRAELPLSARLFETAARLVVFYEEAPSERLQALANRGAELMRSADLEDALRLIGKAGVHDLWVEAGGRLFTSLLPFLGRAVLYVTPKTLGEGAIPAFSHHRDFSQDFRQIRWEMVGKDAELTFER